MRYVILTCTALVLLLLLFSTALAQEVAGFRLTDVSGFLELTYRDDQENTESTGGETDVDDVREQIEFGITTNSYIFHPKLLQMRIAGSLLSDHQDVSRQQISPVLGGTDVLRSEREELLFNLDARLQFLKDKPYPTTISYLRENPVVNTGTEGSFTQETERLGLNFSLLDVLPLNVFVNASKNSSLGESLDRIVDQSIDQVAIKAKQSYSGGDRISLDLEATEQESRNGDKRRPIQETRSRTERLLFITSTRLGSEHQFTIDQTTNIFRRDDPDSTDVRFAPLFSWDHTSALRSQYRYTFSRSDRKDSGFENTAEAMSAMLQYAPTEAFTGLIRGSFDQSDEADRLSQDAYGVLGRATIRRDTALGRLNVSAGLGYRLEDRDSEDPSVLIEEEPVTLVGTTPVPLSREFVIAETVVVRNDTRTQIYIEGIDYLLSVVGSRTRIERLISGSILDGETVLVDYEAETGGTFEYSEIDQDFSADFRFGRYHNVFFRYDNKRQILQSGFSTLPFNSAEGIEFGLREQIPLRWAGIQLSAEARYRRQDEEINPFDQKVLSVSVQAPLPKRLRLQASAARNIIENDLSEEDADVIAFTTNLIWQARRNLTIQLEGSHDEDTGGTILRRNTRWRMTAQWRYRRVSLRMDARYYKQRQGELDSDNSEIWLQIRRELF